MADPLNTPVQTRPTPVKADTLFYEVIDGITADKDRLEYGAPHPDTANFPGFYLCKEERLDLNRAKRWWQCEHTLQDTYNDGVTYMEGNTAYPVFARRYVVLRKEPVRPTLQPLAGLVLAKVTAGGSGYTEVPTVTLSAGAGEVIALVDTLGAVKALVIKAAGAYTTTPTLTISGGNGNGATGTVTIQPQTALLTKQRKVEFPPDDPQASIFVIHECVYETLPGPEIAETKHDPATGTDQTHYSQRVAMTTTPLPVAAIEILSVSVANPTVITLNADHGLPVGTFSVRIAGVTGSTPSVTGDRTATRTGAGTFTIPLNVTVAATGNTGFMSPLKVNGAGVSEVILESYVKPDEDNGAVTGTLLTICATLPGREVENKRYDPKRHATVNTRTQQAHLGFGAWPMGFSLRGGTVERSECVPQGTAWGKVITDTIVLPGDKDVEPRFNEETGGLEELWTTRVAAGTQPDTVGSAITANHYVLQSSVESETSVTSILKTLVGVKVGGLLAPSRTEIVDGVEPMPRVFTFIAGWVVYGDGYYYHGPFLTTPTEAGIGNGNYLLELHSDATPLIVDISYTIGPDPAPVTVWSVLTNRSRFLPIDNLTLHDDYVLVETNATLGDQFLEAMDDSVPAPGDYNTGDPLVIRYTDRPFHGGPNGLWERRVYSVLMT